MSSEGAPRAAHPDCIPALTRREWVLLVALVCAGGVLRLYHLSQWSIWYDEGATIYASRLAADPARLFDPDWLTEPPLIPILLHWWINALRLMGIDFTSGTIQTDFLIRLVPCAFSIATLPIAFGAARRMTRSVLIGLITMFLLAISPFHIFYAQELRPYSSMTFFVTAALWYLAIALETDKTRHWAGMVATLALAMYNHFFTVWYIASFGLAVCIVIAMRRRISYRWVASQFILFVLMIPAIRQGLVVNEVVSRIESNWYPPLSVVNALITVKTFFAGYSPNVFAYRSLLLLGMCFALIGFIKLLRFKETLAVILVIVFAPVVGNLIVWGLRDFAYYEHRLFIECGVVFSIAVAAGTSALRVRAGIAAAMAIWTILTVPCLRDYYAQRIHPSERHRLGVRHKVDTRDLANQVRADLKPTDAIGHFSHFTFFPLRYYYLPKAEHMTLGFTEADREGMLASYPHRSVWEHFGGLPHRLDSVAKTHDRIWYVSSWWEPQNLPSWATTYRGWLNRHAVLNSEYEYDGVRLSLYNVTQARGIAAIRYEQYVDAGTYAMSRVIGIENAPAPLPYHAAPEHSLVLLRNLSSGEISVVNYTPIARTLDFKIFASSEVVEPLTFDRANPEFDQWRPSLHSDPMFVDEMDPVKMSAIVEKDREVTGGLNAHYRLPAGAYRVYAPLWQENEPSNTSRAIVTFSFAGEKSSIEPWVPNGPKGFAWRHIAAITSDGNPQVLNITAACPAHLDRAYVDLGRIVFVPGGVDTPLGYNDVSSGELELGANETKVLPKLPETETALRFDAFIKDEASGEVRFVNWYEEVSAPS